VCSSDLLSWVPRSLVSPGAARPAQVTAIATRGETRVFEGAVESSGASFPAPPGALKVTFTVEEIGRAAGREKVEMRGG